MKIFTLSFRNGVANLLGYWQETVSRKEIIFINDSGDTCIEKLIPKGYLHHPLLQLYCNKFVYDCDGKQVASIIGDNIAASMMQIAAYRFGAKTIRVNGEELMCK